MTGGGGLVTAALGTTLNFQTIIITWMLSSRGEGCTGCDDLGVYRHELLAVAISVNKWF